LTFFLQVVILQKNIIMEPMTEDQKKAYLDGFVKVRGKDGQVREVPEVMFRKQAENMGWTLVLPQPAPMPVTAPVETVNKIQEVIEKNTCAGTCENPPIPEVQEVEPEVKETPKAATKPAPKKRQPRKRKPK